MEAWLPSSLPRPERPMAEEFLILQTPSQEGQMQEDASCLSPR